VLGLGRDAPGPDRADVYRALRQTTGEAAYHGASGVVDFGPYDPAVPNAGADPRCKLVVVQRLVLRDGALVAEFQPHDNVPCAESDDADHAAVSGASAGDEPVAESPRRAPDGP
jgi:hypothetical protein